ncbi:Mpp10 protein [Heliocybe sulcata]|uniref:U3 small nucleolar ribonucleoprotein protein MPP10 n=1 Tax=Heliocybe sulcata TaxID=5364 RepID=A0A5C3NJ67_9AGAM|nr:Mpp10 protein [Heliocybe sulcata]
MATDTDECLKPLSQLSELIADQPEALASGSKDIHQTALLAAKCVFDLALTTEAHSQKYVRQLLSSMAPELAPQTRSQARANGKRKRSPSPPRPKTGEPQTTPLLSLFVEGMDDDQIWAQLELRAKHVCETLEEALEGGAGLRGSDDGDSDGSGDMNGINEEEDESLEDEEDEEDDGDSDQEEEEAEWDDEEGESASREEPATDEETTALRRSSEDEDDESEEEDETDPDIDLNGISAPTSRASAKPSRPKARGHPELDDGFFDLASFNAEIEQAEARTASRGALGSDDEDEDIENGDIDLFAPVNDLQALEEDDIEDTGGEAFYKDFFEPPPKNKTATNRPIPSKTTKVRFHDEVRVKKIKAKGKGLPTSFINGGSDNMSLSDLADQYGEDISDDAEEGMEGSEEESCLEDDDGTSDGNGEDDDDQEFDDVDTMERFKDDLFAEDDEQPESDLSTHERRMAALREQISALEAENVAKKDWTLMGEATGRSRPQNSLLEEDLEFDRVMKVVPVVTEEAVQNLEDRIKSRILESNFDDVVRKRSVDDKPFLPSRFFELQDTKSKQSLAEIYEDEYTAAQTGGVAGEDRDGKLKAEHQEIEKQWEGLCAKLDALCNVHFLPKQPKATISTVSNVAAAALESALPTSKSTTTMLAPEEVYAPSGSAPRSSSELTPAEKRALHNKQRKKKRKARDVLDKTVDKVARMRGVKNVKTQKEAALNSIVKSGKGVTVIGKKIDKGVKKGRSKG